MVKLLAELAPGKINLCLQVTGKRADGYHELDSIFLPIAWSDIVSISTRPSDEPRVSLRCDEAALDDSQSNLASRAAAAFMGEFGIAAEVLVDLRKRIPMGAGLGGGSSDAGAVLRTMATIFGISSPPRLAAVALQLGADVPFFLEPGPARVRGIGEVIEPLSTTVRLNLVIAVPNVKVPTAKVFAALRHDGWSGPLADSAISSIRSGKISATSVTNDLAKPAMALFPDIAKLKALLEEEGARVAGMSGSGGAVFGLYRDALTAEAAALRIRARAPDALVRSVATTSLAELHNSAFSTEVLSSC
jgi:4-diphosphocytidyl-2-C-methyl-D-erythritol kinase